ncbi:sensor histidine kinase, PhoR-related protein [Thermosipho africanus Ob7]|jgi:two-component system OmpR family sensor kinase|uniref:sensor histidine kinase n=1 Tax=Thermosipho africanus TaxID=2421 RepID=UPI000E0BDB69|nr:HAMP domain-containing sensor histidine kinase [Thermosipho africanus]MDK2839261.1 two-component system, OmpR family, sensor kinase [Thermosipho sp. (in: thermotogales)]MDK2900965.1 two-component system, OmpR family, sensor kinase [Thermosipho sp. (in: thermotogales)]RDI92862.1 sensor histidine kinase, PhoR-related protein [Thermosipho africanus Ob7]
MFNFEIFQNFDEPIIMLDGLKIAKANNKALEYGFKENFEILDVFTSKNIDVIIEYLIERKNFELEEKLYFFEFSDWRYVKIKFFDNLLYLSDLTEYIKIKEAKVNFTTAISHELFNPLSIIKANAIYLKDIFNENNKDILEALEDIEKSSKRMERIIKQLKVLAMLELGMYKPKIDIVDFEKILNEVIDELSQKLESKNLTLDLKILNKEYKSDGFMLYTIIKNLLSNSIKYSYNNSTIIIEAYKDKIIISDSGIGIKKEDLEKVTQRFYRSKEATKMATGSGLGLSIVKHICNILNYKLIIESNYLIGTKVIIQF